MTKIFFKQQQTLSIEHDLKIYYFYNYDTNITLPPIIDFSFLLLYKIKISGMEVRRTQDVMLKFVVFNFSNQLLMFVVVVSRSY